MPKIDRMFDELLSKKGSDLHLGVGFAPTIRVRGELTRIREEPVTTAEIEGLLFELLTPAQREKITRELDLDFAHAYGEKARFRANYFYKVSGLGAVFR